MFKKISVILLSFMLMAGTLAGCGSANSSDNNGCPLDDGVYTVDVDTGSPMFHVNEAKDGKGELTVKDGQMTLHISLASKRIVNLFLGDSAEAKESSDLLEPTTDKVTYSDGFEEEVYGFDIPVSALDEEIPVAILGSKGTWYDHYVKVSNPQ